MLYHVRWYNYEKNSNEYDRGEKRMIGVVEHVTILFPYEHLESMITEKTGFHLANMGMLSCFIGMVASKIPLNITVDKDLGQLLRLLARLKFGDKKGSISAAVEEAIKNWIIENKDLIDEDKLWVENFFGEDVEKVIKNMVNGK